MKEGRGERKTKAMIRKCLSLLLAAAMFLAIPGVSAMAETAGQGAETTGQEAALQAVGVSASSPANPVHHCTKQDDGTDYTDWSYVYFGSYPQTEVTGTALNAAITGASYDGNGDAWVGGTKYRRIKESDANYSGSSNGYFQWGGNEEYHYFKWERIKWRVLQNNGSTLFVVADKGLDCKAYHDSGDSITWENCTLRNWLNNDFYSTAFSSAEQGAIVKQNVVSEGHPDYSSEGGIETTDSIFLLSDGEATNPEYGFCENYSTYSVGRRLKTSDYAHAMGVYVETDGSYAGDCWWWLRFPHSYAGHAVGVTNYGDVTGDGLYIYDDSACVPALHINLSSDLWSLTDDGTSGAGGNGGTGDYRNQNIIDRVSEYTSDELYAQYNTIFSNSNYSYETKYKLYQSLFKSYGFTDAREGIHYLSNTTNKRYSYLMLTTDDFYCASNFKYWLKNTAKGKATQAVLLADGLIFNAK